MRTHCDVLFGNLAHVGVTDLVQDEKARILKKKKAAAFTDSLLTFVKTRDRDIQKLIVYRLKQNWYAYFVSWEKKD